MKFVEKGTRQALVAQYMKKEGNTSTVTERPVAGYDDEDGRFHACVFDDEGVIVRAKSLPNFICITAHRVATERLLGDPPSLFESIFGPSIFRPR